MTRADFRRQIDQLKASISLKELVERDGHKLVRNGALWKTCCPFHSERSPSFVIYPDGFGHCFGCAWHGDIFHYIMKTRTCDFMATVNILSNGTLQTGHVPIRRPTVKKEPELPRDYFEHVWAEMASEPDGGKLEELAESLGIDIFYLNLFGVVWSGRDQAWAFPMSDHEEFIIGIRLRDKNGNKFAVKGSKQGLFIPELPPTMDLYVCEGATDPMAILSMGLDAIGKASAMQGPEEIIKFIVKNRIRRVIVIADNDTAGLNGAKKLIYVCPVPCCELVLPAKDAREFYRNGGTRELIENLLKSVVWRNPSAKLGHK